MPREGNTRCTGDESAVDIWNNETAYTEARRGTGCKVGKGENITKKRKEYTKGEGRKGGEKKEGKDGQACGL